MSIIVAVSLFSDSLEFDKKRVKSYIILRFMSNQYRSNMVIYYWI